MNKNQQKTRTLFSFNKCLKKIVILTTIISQFGCVGKNLGFNNSSQIEENKCCSYAKLVIEREWLLYQKIQVSQKSIQNKSRLLDSLNIHIVQIDEMIEQIEMSKRDESSTCCLNYVFPKQWANTDSTNFKLLLTTQYYYESFTHRDSHYYLMEDTNNAFNLFYNKKNITMSGEAYFSFSSALKKLNDELINKLKHERHTLLTCNGLPIDLPDFYYAVTRSHFLKNNYVSLDEMHLIMNDQSYYQDYLHQLDSLFNVSVR